MACKVLVIGHGTLPQDMMRTAEMICGPTEGVDVICLPPDQDMDAYRAAIAEKIDAAKEIGLLIVADLKGGTPFLTASRLMKDYWENEVELVTGLSLPMLTQVLSDMDDLPARELARLAVAAGSAGVLDFRESISKNTRRV